MQLFENRCVTLINKIYLENINMKTTSSLIIIALFTICNLVPSYAQKQDCIICPEMLGIITSSENGVNISTLTPSQNVDIIVSSETQKVEKNKSSKKANRQKAKQEINNQSNRMEDQENDILGFANTGFSSDSNEDCGCGSPTVEVEQPEEMIELFTLYPNPAHHWVVINSKMIEKGSYKLFLKDSQGHTIKERVVSNSSTKLDLRGLKQGVYFVTLRNEKDFTTTVKKVTIQ